MGTIENHEGLNGFGGMMIGLVAGTVLGATLGMIFAPKSGAQLRSELGERAGKLANQASKGYRKAADAASGWADKSMRTGRGAYERTREAVSRGADEAERYVREVADEAASKVAEPRLS
jgi:gas vesicle protein